MSSESNELKDEAAELINRKRSAIDVVDVLLEDTNKRSAGTTAAVATAAPTTAAAIKILCPSEIAGSVIGKGGQIISNVNTISGANCKVSQVGDCYPMTTDRIILIVGDPEKLYIAVDHIMKILLELQDASQTGGQHHVRLVVPLTAGGLLIGKGGSIIKSINEKSGAHVSMETSDDPYATGERICGIKGETLQSMAYAVKLVAAQLLTDKAGTYANYSTKYNAAGVIAAASKASGAQQHNPYAGYQAPTTFQQPFGQVLQYPEAALYNPSLLMQGVNPQQAQTTNPPAASVPHGVPHGAYAQYQAATAQGPQPNVLLTFGIPDRLIAGVLGKAGSGIKEIMTMTGTNIKVSQKGDYMPGTEHRIFSISGPHSAVVTAQNYLAARITSETLKVGLDPFMLQANMEYK